MIFKLLQTKNQSAWVLADCTISERKTSISMVEPPLN